ncbi:MAG: ATPase [Bacillota bacterium]
MDILDVLNELEELVEDSTKVPLVGKVLLDDELVLDMIDHVRTALPEEMRQAKIITQERERILEDARNEAKRIINEAREEITKMAGETEIVRQAQDHARDLVEQSQNLSREIKMSAYQFADELLGMLENNLEKNLATVRSGREELRVGPKAEKDAAAAKE